MGGLALVRAVAPHAIAKLTAVSVRSLAIGAAVLIVVAIILIVMARVASRRGNRVSVRGTAGGAIVAVVFAIMLTVAALLISNLFKDGIVKPSLPLTSHLLRVRRTCNNQLRRLASTASPAGRNSHRKGIRV